MWRAIPQSPDYGAGMAVIVYQFESFGAYHFPRRSFLRAPPCLWISGGDDFPRRSDAGRSIHPTNINLPFIRAESGIFAVREVKTHVLMFVVANLRPPVRSRWPGDSENKTPYQA